MSIVGWLENSWPVLPSHYDRFSFACRRAWLPSAREALSHRHSIPNQPTPLPKADLPKVLRIGLDQPKPSRHLGGVY